MNLKNVSVFNFTTQAPNNGTLDVFIDGAIVDAETEQIFKSYFGDTTSVSYKTFRQTIQDNNPSTLNLFTNCPGGHVGDALAMHDFLVEIQNKGTVVNVFNVGMTASAGTYFQLAVPVKNRFASANSFGLIHNVSGYCYGSLRDMQSYVASAEKMNKAIIDLYVTNTNLSQKKVTDMMDAETLLTAQEMLDYGFVGNINQKSNLKNTLDIAQLGFKNSAILNAYNSFTTPNLNTMENNKTVAEAITNGFNGLLEKLGLTNKANDENVKNAFEAFSTSITNALQTAAPSNEATEKVVNDAVALGFKNIAENESFKTALANAVTEQTKTLATTESVKNAIAEANKNQITKTDLQTAMDNLTNDISAKLGGKSGVKNDAGEGNEPVKRTTPANKYTGKQLWTA